MIAFTYVNFSQELLKKFSATYPLRHKRPIQKARKYLKRCDGKNESTVEKP